MLPTISPALQLHELCNVSRFVVVVGRRDPPVGGGGGSSWAGGVWSMRPLTAQSCLPDLGLAMQCSF